MRIYTDIYIYIYICIYYIYIYIYVTCTYISAEPSMAPGRIDAWERIKKSPNPANPMQNLPSPSPPMPHAQRLVRFREKILGPCSICYTSLELFSVLTSWGFREIQNDAAVFPCEDTHLRLVRKLCNRTLYQNWRSDQRRNLKTTQYGIT